MYVVYRQQKSSNIEQQQQLLHSSTINTYSKWKTQKGKNQRQIAALHEEPSIVSTADSMVETQLCKLRGTSLMSFMIAKRYTRQR